MRSPSNRVKIMEFMERLGRSVRGPGRVYLMADTEQRLPGEDFVEQGLRDLSVGVKSPEALLVLIGAPRLRRLGVLISNEGEPLSNPEHALYQRLQAENPRNAHSRYNALIRRLVSFERALERGRKALRKSGD